MGQCQSSTTAAVPNQIPPIQFITIEKEAPLGDLSERSVEAAYAAYAKIADELETNDDCALDTCKQGTSSRRPNLQRQAKNVSKKVGLVVDLDDCSWGEMDFHFDKTQRRCTASTAFSGSENEDEELAKVQMQHY